MTRFVCQYCNAIFRDHESLKQHYLSAHMPKMQEKAKSLSVDSFSKTPDWIAGTMAWASSVTIEE